MALNSYTDIQGMAMTFDLVNSQRRHADDNTPRPSKDSERSGCATSKGTSVPAEKVRRYSVDVRGGELRISSPVTKVVTRK